MQGERKGMITMERLKKKFGKEVVVGKKGRVTRKNDLPRLMKKAMRIVIVLLKRSRRSDFISG